MSLDSRRDPIRPQQQQAQVAAATRLGRDGDGFRQRWGFFTPVPTGNDLGQIGPGFDLSDTTGFNHAGQ